MPELIRFPVSVPTLQGVLRRLDAATEPEDWAFSPALESGCTLALESDGNGTVTLSVHGPDWNP